MSEIFVIPGGKGKQEVVGAVRLVSPNGDSVIDDANDTLRVQIVGTPTVSAFYNSTSDTYTATGNGTTLDVSTSPVHAFSIAVKGTGASATSWTAILEGSLDNTNFTTLATHETATGDGKILSTGTNLTPVLYYRTRVSALSLGSATNIVVRVLSIR